MTTETFEFPAKSTFSVAHHVGLCKPDPGFYRTALERLAVAPDAVFFFDDVADNVAGHPHWAFERFRSMERSPLRD